MDFREQMKWRAKRIGLEVIKLADDLPNKPAAWVLGKQILRSSTSIGANYRAAYRAKSKADFINRLKIVEEEADETIYWIEIMNESGMMSTDKTWRLLTETRVKRILVVSCSIVPVRVMITLPHNQRADGRTLRLSGEAQGENNGQRNEKRLHREVFPTKRKKRTSPNLRNYFCRTTWLFCTFLHFLSIGREINGFMLSIKVKSQHIRIV